MWCGAALTIVGLLGNSWCGWRHRQRCHLVQQVATHTQTRVNDEVNETFKENCFLDNCILDMKVHIKFILHLTTVFGNNS